VSRTVVVGAAQLGPVARDESRESAVARMMALLREGAERGCELVVFPELALTSFFPRWVLAEPGERDSFFETEMPGPATKALFDLAAELRVGFCLGFAELTPDGHHYNSQILVERDGSVVAVFHKVHIPGHEEPEPWRPFQHLERRYFEPGPEGFGVWRSFGGVVGMMICNDRRWPETYRVMGLQGVELILCGYNTPWHYPPDPAQDPLQGFHNSLVMQSGAYQNGTWVVGVAKGGTEDGCEMLAESCIIAPSGEVVARAATDGDELIVAICDLDRCAAYKDTLFNFERYREIEHYGLITSRRGAVAPPPGAGAGAGAGSGEERS
jgi:predicted amidohydrolase